MPDVYLSATIRPASQLTARVSREAGFRATVCAESQCKVKTQRTVTLKPGETFTLNGVTVIVLKPEEGIDLGRAVCTPE